MHCTAVLPDSRSIEGAVFAGFLHEIACGDAGLARFLQILLRASLFASNALEDHWLAFLIGSGRNGKVTLIEKCAARAMGTCAPPHPRRSAARRRSRDATPDRDREPRRGAPRLRQRDRRRPALEESRLKELPGGDKLSDPFTR